MSLENRKYLVNAYEKKGKNQLNFMILNFYVFMNREYTVFLDNKTTMININFHYYAYLYVFTCISFGFAKMSNVREFKTFFSSAVENDS